MKPALEAAALDRRAYVVYLALIAAENRARLSRLAARVHLDQLMDRQGWNGYTATLSLTDAAATASEWTGIAKACNREHRRLARIKHGGAR